MQRNLAIVYRSPMRKPNFVTKEMLDSSHADAGPVPQPAGSWWQRNLSWIASSAISLTAILAIHHMDAADKVRDEHINLLISQKLDPAIKGMNDHADASAAGLGGKIDALDTKIGGFGERLSRVEGVLSHRISGLDRRVAGVDSRVSSVAYRVSSAETSVARQTSLAKLIDPNRALTLIRGEIALAQKQKHPVPVEQLVDYRNAIHELPSSAYGYWTTVATIVNYQSHLLQMSGEAPDPHIVSKPCPGITAGLGKRNSFIGLDFDRCVIDLDTTEDSFTDVTFKNSVIRYAGGPTHLQNVRFENCTFELNLPPQKVAHDNPLLYALLDSPDQTSIKVK